MAVNYHIAIESNAYVAGEEVKLTLTLENQGTTPVDVPNPEANANWQPTYTLYFPGNPQGTVTNLRARVRGNEHSGDAEAVLISLKPGDKWVGQMILNDLFDLSQLGRYRLSSQLTWKGVNVSAGEVQFEIETFRLGGAGIGLGLSQSGYQELFGAYFHCGQNQRVLFEVQFSEERPDLGEITISGVRRVASTGSDASDPLSPYTNYSRFDDLFNWIAWREGNVCHALSTTGSVVRFEFPYPPHTVITPALMVHSHTLDIFLLARSPDAKSVLQLLRLTDSNPPAPAILWSRPIPVPPAAAAAALAPGGQNDLRHVAFTSEDERLRIFHAAIAGAEPPAKFDMCEIPSFHLVADSKPALIVEKNGVSRVGAIVVSATNPKLHAFAEAVFDRNLPRSKLEIIAGAELPAPVISARTGYFPLPDGSIRRDWAILTADNKLYTHSGVRTISETFTPPASLVFLVLGENSYLLRSNPRSGVFLEAV